MMALVSESLRKVLRFLLGHHPKMDLHAGADTVIRKLMAPDCSALLEATTADTDSFANQGLRTLLVGYR